MTEVITAFAFFGIALVAHFLHELCEKHKCSWFGRGAHYAILGVLFHPAVSESAREYAIHLIIYSGHVLGGH